jgi:hypothetical protein
VRSGAVDVVVIDSVAALVPRSEIEGDMGDAQMGMQARLMSQALRKLSGAINQTKTSVIFTNQLRQKIGVMFGNPETTPGGLALKFYASVRLDIRRIQSIKMGAEIIGNRVRVRVVKNKVAAPFRTAEFDVMYNEGISKVGDIIDLATQLEIVAKRGAFIPMAISALVKDARMPKNSCARTMTWLRKLKWRYASRPWAVQNTGTCNWDERFSLVNVEGPELGVEKKQSLFPARSGSQAILQVTFNAPAEPGTYRSVWQAAGPDGQFFGERFYVEFVVP